MVNAGSVRANFRPQRTHPMLEMAHPGPERGHSKRKWAKH